MKVRCILVATLLCSCCVAAICLAGVTPEEETAQAKYQAVKQELTVAIRERENSPEIQRLEKSRNDVGEALEAAAMQLPAIAALDSQQKALEAKLLAVRQKRRLAEQKMAEEGQHKESVTGNDPVTKPDVPNTVLKDIDAEIASLTAERRRVEDQFEQTAKSAPELQGLWQKARSIDDEIAKLQNEQTPRIKELHERLAEAQSQWARLRAERVAREHSAAKGSQP